MLIAGIVGQKGTHDTANLVNSILSSTGKKVSIVDLKNLSASGVNRTKSYVFELMKNGVDVLILKIKLQNLKEAILENIHFDVMIYTDRMDDSLETNEGASSHDLQDFLSLLDEKGIVIVNADDNELLEFLQNMKQHIVTYGFNSSACITTSSIGDLAFEDKFMCSLQETIPARNGRLIEPQEYIVRLDAREIDSYNVLAAASFAIVNGVDLNSIC